MGTSHGEREHATEQGHRAQELQHLSGEEAHLVRRHGGRSRFRAARGQGSAAVVPRDAWVQRTRARHDGPRGQGRSERTAQRRCALDPASRLPREGGPPTPAAQRGPAEVRGSRRVHHRGGDRHQARL